MHVERSLKTDIHKQSINNEKEQTFPPNLIWSTKILVDNIDRVHRNEFSYNSRQERKIQYPYDSYQKGKKLL